MSRRLRAPAPVPLATVFLKRYRWDTFANDIDAAIWVGIRTREGYRVGRRGKSVWWDQARGSTVSVKPSYPQTKVDHCAKCGERRTYFRHGPGTKMIGRSGLRDYYYIEPGAPHVCPLPIPEPVAPKPRRRIYLG